MLKSQICGVCISVTQSSHTMTISHQVNCHYSFYYTGPRRPGTVCTVSSTESIYNYYDGPANGKFIEISDTDIQIEWIKGTYTSKWVADPRNGRRKLPWTDWVPRSSIILFDFELTPSERLRKATVEHQRRKYDELKHTNEQ